MWKKTRKNRKISLSELLENKYSEKNKILRRLDQQGKHVSWMDIWKKDMALLASSNVISFSDIHSYHDKKIGWNDNYRIHNDTIKKAMLLEITHRTFLSLTAKYL